MDIEAALRALSDSDAEGRLRAFGCDCCDRVSNLCDEPIFAELVAFGRNRCIGPPDIDHLKRLQERARRVYDVLYPGFGTPSAKVLALSAAGEVAFTSASLTAAINASRFAAEAVAAATAQVADDREYDVIYQAALLSERAEQAQLLRNCSVHQEPS